MRAEARGYFAAILGLFRGNPAALKLAWAARPEDMIDPLRNLYASLLTRKSGKLVLDLPSSVSRSLMSVVPSKRSPEVHPSPLWILAPFNDIIPKEYLEYLEAYSSSEVSNNGRPSSRIPFDHILQHIQTQGPVQSFAINSPLLSALK